MFWYIHNEAYGILLRTLVRSGFWLYFCDTYNFVRIDQSPHQARWTHIFRTEIIFLLFLQPHLSGYCVLPQLTRALI